jgi:hypothetical protein
MLKKTVKWVEEFPLKNSQRTSLSSIRFAGKRPLPKTQTRQRFRTLDEAQLWNQRKILSKTKGLDSQQALDEFWFATCENFARHFRVWAQWSDKAQHQSNPELNFQVNHAYQHLFRELSYVERWVATCAYVYSLRNPAIVWPIDHP